MCFSQESDGSSEDHAIGRAANQAIEEVGNSLGGGQWRQRGVFVVSGAAGIGKSSSAEQSRTHAPLFDKHLAKDIPMLIRGLLMTSFFPRVVSVYGHANFSSPV